MDATGVTTQVSGINTSNYVSNTNSNTNKDGQTQSNIEKNENVKSTDNTKRVDDVKGADDTKELQNKAEKRREEEKEKKEVVSEVFLKNLKDNVEIIHKIGLNFTLHDSTGKTMVKVMNRDTDELIREIPSEEFLDFAAKMDEFVGLLFDKKA